MKKVYLAIHRLLNGINITSSISKPLVNTFFVLLALSFGQQSFGQTNTWNGFSSTNWSTAGNWSLNRVPLATDDVIIPNASGTPRDPIINVAASCKSLTISAGGLLTSGAFNLDVNANWTNNSTFTAGTGTVTFKAATNNTLAGTSATTFYNLIINKGGAANTITSTAKAFTANNLTITLGNLILQATDANYTVTNDVTVSTNGTLTHSVGWDVVGKQLTIGGSIFIDGIFTYTIRSHVQMNGMGAETVRTGTNALSAFCILTLLNGNFSASGNLKINDNFWSMFGSTGSFHTANQAVIANSGVLINGGTVFVDGGSLNVSNGIQVGYTSGLASAVNLSAGTLTADGIVIGAAAPITASFSHSGGTAIINGALTIATTGTYTCTNSPAINISGDWTNNGAFAPATSTVTFNNTSAAQNILGSASGQNFSNIIISKPGQSLNVSGTAGNNLGITGNWTNTAGIFVPGTGKVTFNGTTAQQIIGPAITSFNNVTLNNAAGLSLNGINTNINGGASALTFTSGKITTGANTLTLGNSATTSGAGAGKYVYGNLQLGIASGAASRTFDIGDATNYTPVTIALAGVSNSGGSITAFTVGSQHPNIATSLIDDTQDINRYYSLVNNGVTLTSYNPTFTFINPGDLIGGANPSNFIVGLYNGSWAYPGVGTKTTTATQATGISTFGTFALGIQASIPTINTQPSNQNICVSGATSFTTSANNLPNSTVVWQISTDGGGTFNTLSIVSPYSVTTSSAGGITTSTLNISSITGLNTFQYKAKFTNTKGNVTSNPATLTVSNPAAPTGSSSQSFCAINNPTVASLATTTGIGIKWYAASSGGSALVSTTSLVNNTHYFASQTVTGCEGTARFDVIVTIGSPAAPTGTASQSFCADANPSVANLTATGTTIQWYSTLTGGTALAGSTVLVDGTHYYASQTLSGCESATRFDVTVVVYQPVVITSDPAPASNTVCATFPVSYSVTATGSNLTYQWLKDGNPVINGGFTTGATTANLQISQAQVADGGVYSVIVSGSSPCTSQTSATATLIVNQKIIFTTQPAPTSTVCQGQPYTISATATGTVASYIWKKAGVFYANAVYDGINTYSLTIPSVAASDAGSYQLTLDDGTGIGCALANSTVAVLTVNPTPVATISGNTTVCQSSSPAPLVTFTNPNALPVTITYSINSGSNLTINVGANTSATVAAPTGTAGTFNYNLVSVAYQSGPGCSNAISGTATVTVNPTPVATISGTTAVCQTFSPAPLVIFTNPQSLPVTVTYNINGASTTTINVGSATSATIAAPTGIAGIFNYNLVNVAYQAGPTCSNIISGTATVTINPGTPATPGSISGTVAQCPALINQVYSIAAVTNATTYTWAVPTGWAITSGSGTTSITVTTGAPGQNGNITVSAGNPCGTSALSSLAVIVNAGAPATPGLITGTTGQCPALSGQTYSIAAVTNATTYTWTVPTGWSVTGGAGTTSITVTTGTPGQNGNITVKAANSCGTSTANTFAVTVNPGTPAIPTANSGSGATCSQITANWTASANATGYFLDVSTVNTFATFVTGYSNLNVGNVTTINVTGLSSGTTYYYHIRASNNCGTSANSSLITYATLPSTPAIPTANAGSAAACSQITANWSSSANATAYFLDVATDNAFGSFVAGYNNLSLGNITTINVTGLASGTTYYYRVRSSNSCGTSGNSLVITYATSPSTPAIPGLITGTTPQCPGLTGQTYSVAAVTNATTYTWTVPSGWTLVTGAGTRTITVTTGASGQNGNITVTAGNSCGTSAASTLAVTVNPGTPANPGTITGTGIVCPGASLIYSIAAVANATTYTWAVPTGWTITAGQGTTTLSVTAGAAGQNGSITVTAGNSCGTSSGSQSINITPAIGTDNTGYTDNNGPKNSGGISVAYNNTRGYLKFPLTSIPNGSTVNSSVLNLTNNGTGALSGVTNFVTGLGTNDPTITSAATLYTIIGSGTNYSNSTWNNTGTIALTLNAAANSDIQNNITSTDYIALGLNRGNGSTTYIFYGYADGANAPMLTINYTVPGGNLPVTVSPGTPAVPGTISGASLPCKTTSGTYSITAVANATSYTWTVPTGWSITAGQGTTSITATSGAIGQNGNISVTATNSCGTSAANTLAVTVNVDASIALNSSAATTAQTVCINTAITPITYLIGGSGTGASLTAPAGLSGSYNSGTKIYTISGSPTTSGGPFTYTVTATGPCIKPALTGTITVTPNATISLSSASGTDAQIICTNTAILNITYLVGATGTGATVTGLPTGVTGSYNAGSKVFTLSGTPTVPGNYNYTVTTTGPCANPSLSGTISATAIPTGTFTANNTSICAGSSVTFTLAPAGYGSYIFKVNGAIVQSGTSNVYSSSILTNGASVTVDVANSLNCGTTFGPIVITVAPAPATSLIANKTSICPGDNVTFTAGVIATGNSYNFKVDGSSIQSGASNTYSTTTLINGNSVTVDVTNSNGCTATSSPQVITVNSLPSGTLTPLTTTICSGTNVTFTASGSYPTYEFKINGVSVQGPSASNTYSTNALTNGQVVTVIATNASGCSAPFNSVVATVNALPAGTFTASENSGTANDGSICPGAPVTFVFNSGYSNYNFKVNGTTQQNGTSNSYINTTLNTGDIVTVLVSSNSGCNASFTAPAITIVPAPSGTLSFLPASICAGDNVTFTADAGFANYNFQVNGASVQNGVSNTYSSISFVNGDIVTVDVTNSNGCVTTFNTVTLTVHALATGTLVPVENSGNTANDGIICTGAAVVFTAPAGYAHYDFLLNGATIQGGTSNIYNNNTLANGDMVQVAITNASGCIGLLNTDTITVNSLPAVSPITGILTMCLNSTTPLSDATTGGVWTSADPSIATIDPSTGLVTGIAAGSAQINYTFTNTNGCSTVVTSTVTVNAPPVVASISGNVNVCTGSTSQLSDATAGGSWASSNPSAAIVDASGLVSGVTVGNSVISYTVTVNGCTTTVTTPVTISDFPVVASINPSSPNVCIGNTISLTDATSGGTWSSNNTAVATINASGVVTGVASGTSVIDYTVNTTCGQTVKVSVNVTVSAPPSATIAYTGSPFCTSSGPITVIQTGTPGGTYTAAAGLTIDGNTGTITPATSADGSYVVTYSIPASGGCGLYTTTANVVITAAPSAIISYSGPYCTSSAPVSVGRTGTPGGIYSSTSGLTIDGTTGTITPATSTNGTYIVSYTIAASGGCAQFITTTPVTITTAPSATISYAGTPFCTSAATVNVTMTGTPGGTYSVSPAGLTINASTGTITPASSAAGSYLVTYTITSSGGCATYTTTTTVNITSAPTAVAGAAVLTCANSGSVNITAGSNATNQSSVLWTSSGTSGTIANANSLTAASYTPSAADISAGTVTLTLTATGNSPCGLATSTKVVTISAPPVAPTITVASTTICQNSVQPLSAGTSPTSGAPFFASAAALNLAIPDYSLTGVTNTVSVAGIPAGAVINSVNIKFNITHTYDGDLVINLKAPNGNVLNLVDLKAGGANFTNTNVNSLGGSIFTNGTGAPFTGTYSADADYPVPSGAGNTPNVTAFASLFGVPNGSWTLSVFDLGSGDVGTLNNWTITVNYTVAATPQPVTWSPITDLYTDAGGTIAYTGDPRATVYTKPATPGTKTYTAVTTGATCSNSSSVTLTVNPAPAVSITADYCSVPGKVHLTAASIPAAASYTWNTGATTQSIDVDIAAVYKVTASLGSGCPGTATISVAQELVVNGDFTNGNTGFTSDYNYKPDVAGNNELVDDSGNNGYSVTTNGQNVHYDFWGRDHTNNAAGNRNFMLVNGHGTSLVVWKQTVNVLPNTTYYFSAWAMSLNDVGPFAQLRFSVNGALVGTTAVLATGQANNSNNGWIRFYGTWTSGPAITSANIQINDLQTSLPGNDFGIDDVSFGTLSTFVSLNSAPGTDAQTLCVNNAITPIVYSVGSTSSGPTFSPAIPGITTSFNGVLFTISGTPTVAGNYSYSVTTTGSCNPSTATGTINVQSQTIGLTSGSGAPVCVNTPIPNVVYTLGGTATSATVAGLPTGITGAVTAGNTFTISGTASVSGIFPYTITTSGTCAPVTMAGSITIQSQTITLNSANASQTACINAPVANIQYTIGGTGTNASVTGLPPGVTGNYSGGLFIISGTPTSATGSPYTYTVTTTGTCSSLTATGTITVTPAASLSLTSASGTNAQVVCKGNVITNITYTVANGTNASATGLPLGVNGSYSAGVFTISGAPTSAAGTFTYTITAAGGCASGKISGTITVQVQTITLTSGTVSPSVCLNTSMPAIVYTIGGTATSATVSGLPAGITGSLLGNAFTISGTTAGPSGAYPYTVTTSGSCGQVTATGTITVQPAAIGGTLTSATSICSGGSGSLSLLGQSGTVVRWEYSTNGGSSWTSISNTTISQSYTNITTATLYRVVVGNGCGTVFSSVAAVGIHNLWTGAVSTDWNVAGNWSDNLVPSMSCPLVYIPNTPNQPILSNGTGAINNLQISPNASLIINGTGYLKIAGTITNGGSFDVTNGSLELNGTSQSVSGSVFTTRAIKNLIVSSGGSGLSVSNTAGDTLNILGSLSFGNATADLNTGGNITLKSTSLATASIGIVAAGNIITGDVTVERYIGTGTGSAPNHAKSWQLLAIPTQGQTIKQAWQENASASDIAFPAAGSAGNPHTGYGTMITSAITTATTLGFDGYTAPGASMKVFNSVTNGYDGPVSASLPIYNQKGYFVFVRGDRSISVYNQAAIPTILRTKGTLFTPANPPASTNVANNSFESVGNPYASALDIRNIGRSAHVNATFQVWDPRLGGGYNYGAFQTFIINPATGNYEITPGFGSYGAPGSVQNFIQSGQAFIVQTSGGTGTVSFTENAKVSGSALFSRPASASQVQSLRTGLYNGAGTELIDGVLNQFDDSYENAVDALDARKSGNTGENLSIKTAATLLVVERKHTISAQDTIFLNLTGEKAQPYQFQFTADNIKASGLEGFLEDNYLHTRTQLSLSGSTVVNFTIVNIAGSYAPDRFRIVFKSSVVLPVTFTSVKAYQQDKNINVEWRVENEVNIKQYEVEKSINGTAFTTLAVKAATANGGRSAIYVSTDISPVTGYNYYRVKSVDIDGKVAYTNIVKVLMGSIRQDITIYPNPITDGSIHLQLLNQPEGKYGLRLINKIGQIIVSKQINHAEGSSTELIKWDFNLAHGLYNLEVTKPDGSVKNINVLY